MHCPFFLARVCHAIFLLDCSGHLVEDGTRGSSCICADKDKLIWGKLDQLFSLSEIMVGSAISR